MGADGQHVVADFWGCQLPDTEAGWRHVVLMAVESMQVTLLNLDVHLFEPQGATAVAVLAESHLAIHTWPERDYVAVDVFTCGASLRTAAGIAVLRRELKPRRERVLRIARGGLDDAPTGEESVEARPRVAVGERHTEGPACR